MASNLLILRSKDILGMYDIFRNMRFRNAFGDNCQQPHTGGCIDKMQ